MRTARPPRPGLTGIAPLRDTLAGATAVFCCAGTSLAAYDDNTPPRAWTRFAINGALTKFYERVPPQIWVLADSPILEAYATLCNPWTRVLAMHEAGPLSKDRLGSTHTVYTTESTNEAREYADGVNFFSRGTVLIGALEMARYMGVKRAFVFGLDCYATKSAYYYDGRRPTVSTEARPRKSDEIEGGLLVTPRLRRMIEKLDEAKAAGLWDGMEIWCVGSPRSQQRAIAKMTVEEFGEIARKEVARCEQSGD